MVYCHTTGHTIDDVLEDYARHKEMGFKAIRVQCGVPGMKTTYGMAKGKGLAYEPATKGAGRKSSCGPPRNTSTSRPNCSTQCAASSVSVNISFTTCTTV